MVTATIVVWYISDVFYNRYDIYLQTIGADAILSAWWQVLIFIVSFGILVVPVHRWLNRRLLGGRSQVMKYLESNHLRSWNVQRRISLLENALLSAWLILMGVGLIRVQGDVIGLFAPYLGHKADPWQRGQIGSGFSAVISMAAYLQIFFAAAFGVLAALATNRKTQGRAILICSLTLPYYIFDRTRNTMLATVLPGLLSFLFLRVRAGIMIKAALLLICFSLVNFWFSFVLVNRSDSAIAEAFHSGGRQEALRSAKHEGLNMFEELAWINRLTATGVYKPNNGQRYLAELANPIPRVLWKNKPTIGLDYAVARGQRATGPNGEVTATISTGMIGQGVVNFGALLGPIASAFLMTIWVAILARQDLQGNDPGRLILYGCGMILTFNMGRDITLLVLYPFFFGLALFKALRRNAEEQKSGRMTSSATGKQAS